MFGTEEEHQGELGISSTAHLDEPLCSNFQRLVIPPAASGFDRLKFEDEQFGLQYIALEAYEKA